MLKVVSKRSLSREISWTDIYVGRPSPLGNPFALKSEEKRDEVCDRYRIWLWEQIKKGRKGEEVPAWKELLRIGRMEKQGEKIRLVCWCHPARCHADIIANAVSWLVRENLV